MELQIYVKFLVGLFAIVNPVGLLPVFISLTDNLDSESRNQTNRTANIAVAIILIISLLAGSIVLDIFSISINSFRIAGGLLVVMIGMTMINGKLGENKQNKEELSESITKSSVALIPLALPLMGGPGAITSMIVWSTNYPSFSNLVGFIICILVFCSCCWLLFRSAPFITRALGRTGLNVVTRIMGLLLMALGVEIMIGGIRNIFPGLL
ncbi:YchE family NAAT transporter [Orbus sturtevantii]|uniref:YchE family NAAT transporter n=1 Tax=Orbus sturtevantii TaxID=3074109 RepID=UPI00370D62CB